MRVIPAIDLKDGQCVRLQKGDYGTAHKVAENPVETAQRFLDAGADLVHMVDLDAAKDGSHANYGVVEQVIRETGATVELGGGIRSMQDVETVLALGVSRVIIGSAAVRDPEFVAEAVKKYSDKIVVGIDAKSETVRLDHDREAIVLLNPCNGFGGIGENLVLRRRDSVALHEILREHLTGLNDGRVCARTEGGDPLFFESVDHTGSKRIVGRDKNEINLLFLREGHNGRNVHRRDCNAFRILRDTAVAGRTVQLSRARALLQLADNGMLPSAAADH